MPKIFFWKTTRKCIFSYKNCLIFLEKIFTGFGTSITGEPVDQEKTKNFGCQKFTWLHIAENRLLISSMVLEKNDWVGWVELKKQLPYSLFKFDLRKYTSFNNNDAFFKEILTKNIWGKSTIMSSLKIHKESFLQKVILTQLFFLPSGAKI